MCKVKLYRGVCNIYEVDQILTNGTIGGQTTFEDTINPSGKKVELKTEESNKRGETKFSSLIESSVGVYKRYQGGTGGENLPRIVNITSLRPLIEYTTDQSVATRFGLLGVITVIVDTIFLEPVKPLGPEYGVFCVSNGILDKVSFQFNPEAFTRAEIKSNSALAKSLADFKLKFK